MPENRGAERTPQRHPDELTTLLADERTRTLARIAALSRDIDDIIERSSDASRDDEHDPEGATIAFERAQAIALLETARRHLDDIEQAEARIGCGVHGVCETCGEAISRERHLARPVTRRCRTCAN